MVLVLHSPVAKILQNPVTTLQVPSGEVIVYTGTIAKATTWQRTIALVAGSTLQG
jgi:hypothetical protein